MGGTNTEKIWQPIKIAALELKNRFVMPSMVTNYCSKEGYVTEKFIEYHKARARGGVGLIIIEATYVSPSAKGFSFQAGISRDEHIKGMRMLTDAVHEAGSKVAVQLYHAGRQTHRAVTGTEIYAPSAIPCPVGQEKPKEMSVAEIKAVVENFGEAARRAVESGFDAIEIHGAHGYLLNQFLSSYSNQRKDEYGGVFENRARFPLEVLERVRNVAGKKFPIIYRMSSEEFVPGGLTVEDTKKFAKLLVEKGIDAIHVSGGVYESAAMIIQPAAIHQGCYVENAAAIREEIEAKVPVIVVGRIKEFTEAEKIIRDEKADLVAMGRALLADPEFPRKAFEKRFDEIRKCIACNQGCIDRLFQDIDIGCLVNAQTGNEYKYDLNKPSKVKKRLMVIGGGPAGMEAARVAAERGHEAVLYERNDKLGGQLLIASIPPHKEEIGDLTEFLSRELARLKVKVVLGTAVTEDTVKREKPDAIVLAAGAKPIIPNIKGIEQKHVSTAHDILTGKVSAGSKTVIVGGGSVGCEVAEYIAAQGKEVFVLEMLKDVATDTGPLVKALQMKRIEEANINILTSSKVTEILAEAVAYEKEGKKEKIGGIDTIVLAVGAKSETEMLEALDKMGIPYINTGDCVEPRKIWDAIHEGFRAAYDL